MVNTIKTGEFADVLCRKSIIDIDYTDKGNYLLSISGLSPFIVNPDKLVNLIIEMCASNSNSACKLANMRILAKLA